VPDGAFTHMGVVAAQTLLHPPQWVICERSVSQMSAGLAVQCANPGAHEGPGTEHTPALHVTPTPGGITCGFVVQSFAHAPQFFASVCTLVHVPEHDVLAAGGHEHPPPPIVHTWPLPQAAQAAPFVPQLLPVCADVTHPVASQQPLGHEVALHATHAPAEQI
jgi:hypothetical protein